MYNISMNVREAFLGPSSYLPYVLEGVNVNSSYLSPLKHALIAQTLSHLGTKVNDHQRMIYGDDAYCSDAIIYALEQIFKSTGVENPFNWENPNSQIFTPIDTQNLREYGHDSGAIIYPDEEYPPQPGDILTIEYLDRALYANFGERENLPLTEDMTGHGHTALIIGSYIMDDGTLLLETVDANLSVTLQDENSTFNTFTSNMYLYDTKTGDISHVNEYLKPKKDDLYGVMTGNIIDTDLLPASDLLNNWLYNNGRGGRYFSPTMPIGEYNTAFRQQELEYLSTVFADMGMNIQDFIAPPPNGFVIP